MSETPPLLNPEQARGLAAAMSSMMARILTRKSTTIAMVGGGDGRTRLFFMATVLPELAAEITNAIHRERETQADVFTFDGAAKIRAGAVGPIVPRDAIVAAVEIKGILQAIAADPIDPPQTAAEAIRRAVARLGELYGV